VNSELASHLRDIRGLDAVPWWPPGPGWWLLAAIGLAAVVATVYLLRHMRRYPAGSWHRSAWKELRRLKRQAERMPADQLAGALSELMRRIAIARVGRAQAASLTGEPWLEWLQQHDPEGFAWTQRGQPLLKMPYAPPEITADGTDQLLVLVDAAFPWTQKRKRLRRV
jgi:hypothetical protein